MVIIGNQVLLGEQVYLNGYNIRHGGMTTISFSIVWKSKISQVSRKEKPHRFCMNARTTQGLIIFRVRTQAKGKHIAPTVKAMSAT